MSRQTPKKLSEMSPEQQAVFAQITTSREGVKDGHIGGPFDVWLLNPEMAKRIVGLGSMFRFRSSVDRRWVELTILITGQFWQSQFEWYAHEPMARDANVPEELIQAIKQGDEPPLFNDKDTACYHLINELHQHHQVTAETFHIAAREFGEQGVAELINLAGYYTMVSMTLNTFDVGLPEGAVLPFPDTAPDN